jgi:RimJ/RimL family protein N-acetyltransferase
MSTAILRDFPARIETPRLTLRAPQPGDGQENYTAIAETLEELQPWMPWACEALSPETQEAVMRRAHADFLARTDLMLLMVSRDTGAMIGSTGLHNIDWRVPKFEIGYWLRKGYTGQGYMTETVSALAAFAFETLGAQRVEIRCDERNRRSAAVAHRCGFGLEGVLRNDGRHHQTGELTSTMVFARTPA